MDDLCYTGLGHCLENPKKITIIFENVVSDTLEYRTSVLFCFLVNNQSLFVENGANLSSFYQVIGQDLILELNLIRANLASFIFLEVSMLLICI